MQDKRVSIVLSLWMIALSAIGGWAVTTQYGREMMSPWRLLHISDALIFALLGIVGLVRLIESLLFPTRRPTLGDLGKLYGRTLRTFLGNRWILVVAGVIAAIAVVDDVVIALSTLASAGGWARFSDWLIEDPSRRAEPITTLVNSLAGRASNIVNWFTPGGLISYAGYSTLVFAVLAVIIAPRLSKWLKPLTFDPEYARDAQVLRAAVWPLAVVSAGLAIGMGICLHRTGRLPGVG